MEEEINEIEYEILNIGNRDDFYKACKEYANNIEDEKLKYKIETAFSAGVTWLALDQNRRLKESGETFFEITKKIQKKMDE